MPFVGVMFALLLYLGSEYFWPVRWWNLPSGWMTERLNPHHILYIVVQVLTEQSKTTHTQTKTSKTHPNNSNIIDKRSKNNMWREKWNIRQKSNKRKREGQRLKVIMRGEKGTELIQIMN